MPAKSKAVSSSELGWFQVRVSGEERKRSDALLENLLKRFPIATRAGLIRAALRLGFDALEREPELALARGAKADLVK